MATKLRVIKTKGKPEIKFREGSLHHLLGVPENETIPAEKMQAAKEGKYGDAAKKKALFAQNVLTGRK